MPSRYSRRIDSNEEVPLNPEDLPAWMDADDWEPDGMIGAGEFISRSKEWRDRGRFNQPNWLTDAAQASEEFGPEVGRFLKEVPEDFISWIRGLMSGKQFSPRGEMENFQELDEGPSAWRPGRKWDPPRTY